MPMPNNDFNWRPNDNSAKTNLRYTLEAEKWLDAVSSAQRKNQSRSMAKDFLFIGMVVQLIFSVILLILFAVLKLVSLLVQLLETSLRKIGDSGEKSKKEEVKEPETTMEDRESTSEIPEKKYPKGWQLIFYTSYGRLRLFWQFIYLLVFIFIIEVVVLYFLSYHFPKYVSFNQDTLLMAGVISLWFALTGAGE